MGDSHKAKSRLIAYGRLCDRVEYVEEQLERICTKMYTVGSVDYSGMPKSPSPSNDMMVNIISRRDGIAENLKSLKAEQAKELAEILSAVRGLKSNSEKEIIKSRYLDRKSWAVISVNIFGKEKDYEEHIKAYQAKIFREHDNALIELGNFWFT